ncbi:MAG: ankyrin repeat domain-containing protein [Kiritimatiellaeota bacterium]|nr:ankyrin repeat domain-containing protein [Kiritimatiellota bacterium]
MLEAGAKLDILSALYLGKRDEVKLMVAADPAILREHEKGRNLWHNNTPLGIAAQDGDKELVELFLKNGAPVDGATSHPMTGSMTPLTNALGCKRLDVAELLLKAGASLDVVLGGNKDPRLTLLQWVDKQPDPQIKELVHRYAEKRTKENPAPAAPVAIPPRR